jgi:hypothetical protein
LSLEVKYNDNHNNDDKLYKNCNGLIIPEEGKKKVKSYHERVATSLSLRTNAVNLQSQLYCHRCHCSGGGHATKLPKGNAAETGRVFIKNHKLQSGGRLFPNSIPILRAYYVAVGTWYDISS